MATQNQSSGQRIAIVSVYDKTGLLDLAKGLVQQNVRILASGGTSKMIRESGFPVEYGRILTPAPFKTFYGRCASFAHIILSQGYLGHHKGP